MAAPPREIPAREYLKSLIATAPQASFFQVLRLVEMLHEEATPLGSEQSAFEEKVRIRPSVSLALPPRDIESIEQIGQEANERYQLTVTFLGLYGVDSPLPNHFAERVAQIALERRGERLRAFYDVFHHRLYSLLFRAWKRSLPINGTPTESDPLFDKVLAPIGYAKELGLGLRTVPRLREARLLVLRARTAAGLAAILRQRLSYRVWIDQLQPRVVAIPANQRSRLGEHRSELGKNMIAGANVHDCNKFKVGVSAKSLQMWLDLAPEGRDRQDLDEAVNSYIGEPLDYEVEVVMSNKEVPRWRLGSGLALGRATWLSPPQFDAKHRWQSRKPA